MNDNGFVEILYVYVKAARREVRAGREDTIYLPLSVGVIGRAVRVVSYRGGGLTYLSHETRSLGIIYRFRGSY